MLCLKFASKLGERGLVVESLIDFLPPVGAIFECCEYLIRSGALIQLISGP